MLIEASTAGDSNQGDIIKGSGGIRKLSFALTNNKGKSRRMRIIYFYHNNISIFLVAGFVKGKMENIDQDGCSALKTLNKTLINLYKYKE